MGQAARSRVEAMGEAAVYIIGLSVRHSEPQRNALHGLKQSVSAFMPDLCSV